MEEKQKPFWLNVKLMERIILISAIFSLSICILLIVNFIQLNRIDPVNTKTINALVERLNENPSDDALRNQIRELDLLARKAYFTNRWQIRTGGYLLLIGIIVSLISYHLISSNKSIEPQINEEGKTSLILRQKIIRKWMVYAGSIIVLFALFSAILTHYQLGNSFSERISKNSADSLNLIANGQNSVLGSDSLGNSVNSASDSLNSANDTIKAALTEFPAYEEIIKNFPTFRGYGGNGIAYQKDIPISWDGASGKNIKWKFTIPLPGYNSPVVWGDKVFISGANASKREIYCIDRLTGKLLWTVPVINVPGSSGSSPKVSDDTGLAAPTMATDGRRAVAIFANGDIMAVDMDGKKIWAKSLGVPENHYGHSSSLMIIKNLLYVQYDQRNGPKLMALDIRTGQTVWSTARQVKISWASPVIAYTGKQTEILLIADPYLASYNPFTGKENWKIDCTYGEVGASVAYADSIVFAQNEYAKLVAIKIGEMPQIIWENDEYMSDAPSPVATKDFLFSVTSYGTVICYKAKTGEKLWSQEFGNGFYSSPMLVGGKIYLIDKKGLTHIFSASVKYSAIGSPALGENVVSTPAFADGQIFIRGYKNLYCIGK
jgi:outer membrane protein assembly factor BamB